MNLDFTSHVGMRRILKWFALGVATLVVVLIALLLSLPLLLDSELVKSAALQHLSRATGGQWQVARFELRWLPLPTISVEGASFDIPGSAQGKVESLTLTTALLPLLRGDIRLSHVALVAPDVTVTVAPTPASAAPSGTFTVSDLRAALVSIVRLKAVDLDSLEFDIERGRFVLAMPGQASLTLSGIKAHAANRSGRLELQLSTGSDVAQHIDLDAKLDAERFQGGIQLDVKGIDLATLLAVAGAQGTGLQSLISLRARITADSSPALKGTFDASADQLAIDSDAGKLALQGVALDGEAVWTDAGLQLIGHDVHTTAPAVQTTAVLTFSPDWNQQHLQVKMARAGLDTVKQLTLPWTTGTPQVTQYAQMITAGELSGVEAALQLDRIDQWKKAIEVRGTLSGAAMTLKRPELPIRDLSANLALVQGELHAQDVKAVSGNTSIRDGRIDLDFTTTQTALIASAQWQADLAQALAFTRRELAPSRRAKLDALRELTGEARGSVALDGTFDRLQVHVQADALRAQASLAQLPWPLTVTGAKVRFDANEVDVQGLAGKLGDSAFTQCNGRITLAGASQLRISGCQADLALVELFGWASKRFELPAAVKDLHLLAGRALVQVRTLAGAMGTPARWTGDLSVTPRAVRLTHPQLPDELRLDGGSIRGDLRAVSAQGIRTEVLDAALQLSGSVSGLDKGAPRVEVDGTGPIGEKILAWSWDRAGLRDTIAAVLPFEARRLSLKWPAEKGFETAGELMFAGKTAVSFDALVQARATEVRRVSVRDELSNVQMTLRRRKGVLEGSFSGTLSGASLDRIVQARQSPQTRVSGDLKYRVPIKRPRDFSANGTLQINQLSALGWSVVPVDTTIKSADLTATGRNVQLTTSFTAKETSFDVSGSVRGTDRRYVLDLDVRSDRVDLNHLLPPRDQGVKGPDAKDHPEAQPQSWDLPVEGRVRLALQSLRYARYRVAPLFAAIDIAPEQVNASIREARMCGIGVTGGGRAQPASMSLDLVLQARQIDTEPTLLCLTRERTALSGRLDADAHVTANAPYRELPQRLQGPFHLVARDGRVDRMTGLAQVLNLVNASELLRGRNLGLREAGFAYDKFVMKGTVAGPLVQFDEVVLDAQPFDLVAHGSINWIAQTVDMNVAIAPLQVLNIVVKFMPFLGYVLGGGVYAVPVGVRGPLANPEIIPVAPTAVAGSIFGMLQRTLQTPFNLRQALIPPIMQTNTAAGTPAAPPTPGANQ
jgi:uncharacterized protein involved in outer membrane biogenesis